MQVQGQERWYLLSTPVADPATPKPLVLDFHGLAEGATAHKQMTRFGDLAQQEHFIVAMPNGTGQLVHWNLKPDVAANPDLMFVRGLIDKLESEMCIDTSRIYSTGLSMGAMMTSVVACTMGDRIAAVAPVSGVIMPNPCPTRRAVPMLVFHGTADPILPFAGGVGDALGRVLSGKTGGPTTTTTPPDLHGKGYPVTVDAWAARNGCDVKSSKDTQMSKEILRRTYSCPQGVDVIFDIVLGGGHSWPGSQFSKSIASVVGPTTFDVDATEGDLAVLPALPAPATRTRRNRGWPCIENAAPLCCRQRCCRQASPGVLDAVLIGVPPPARR